MKFLFLCITLSFFTSCTHGRKMEDVEKRIQTSEVKEYEVIREDIQLMIEGHPELSVSQREKLKSQLLGGFERHRLLKDQERQIIGLLLHANLDPSENDGVRQGLKTKLEEVYKTKARNIEEVVENVAVPLRNGPSRPEFENDLKTLMREFR